MSCGLKHIEHADCDPEASSAISAPPHMRLRACGHTHSFSVRSTAVRSHPPFRAELICTQQPVFGPLLPLGQLGSASRSSRSNQIASLVAWSWTGFPSILTSRTLFDAWELVMDTPAGVAFEADTEGVLGVQRVQKPFLTAM